MSFQLDLFWARILKKSPDLQWDPLIVCVQKLCRVDGPAAGHAQSNAGIHMKSFPPTVNGVL